MAAYAALVSLMNIIDNIQNHPRLSTCLDKNQIESLGERIDFLLDFVERYNSHGGINKEEVEDLESQIASAAHAAEDVIESHIVDLIPAGSTKESSILLLDLHDVIEDMDSIKKKVMEFKEKWGFQGDQTTYSMHATSSKPLTTGKNTMEGFDDELIQLLDVLTREQSSRQVTSIVGMGGMGKTTLAGNVYENLVIMQHFDTRAWATISQDYNVRDILSELLSCQEKSTTGTVDKLGEQLYKSLSGRRYLIILDDLWSVEAWDKIKFFFPDNGNRSRVVLTTRLSNVAIYCGSSCFKMNFLDENKSWNLFREKLFGEEECPPELERTGKEIAKQCRGLPLSIVVIGGLLRESCRTVEYWQNVAKNINSILSSGENEQCLNVLSLSYRHLPAHLKPCFLYMRIFKEDYEIPVSRIIKLWVAEGFLKPNGDQIFEEIAKGNLEDLVDRNLILVSRRGANGKIKSCRLHDLLRDLCLRIAEKEKFFCVITTLGIPQGIDRERRLVFHYPGDHTYTLQSASCQVFNALQSTSLARSLKRNTVEMPLKLRLLRVLDVYKAFTYYPEAIFQTVNLRYLSYHPQDAAMSVLPSSISLLWNLQTLIIEASCVINIAPFEIWKMPQLRHLELDAIYLPDPPPSDQQDDFFVLGNLQTLLGVVNFRWSEEVSKRIPNVKKLHVTYNDCLEGYDECLFYYLHNLGRLQTLESLKIEFFMYKFLYSLSLLKKNVTFPVSLNKFVFNELSSSLGRFDNDWFVAPSGSSEAGTEFCLGKRVESC